MAPKRKYKRQRNRVLPQQARCPECHKSLHRGSVADHLRRFHAATLDPCVAGQYACKLGCDEVFSTRINRHRHHISSHGHVPDQQVRESGNAEFPYCTSALISKAASRRYSPRFTPGTVARLQARACDQCHRRFPDLHSLRQHKTRSCQASTSGKRRYKPKTSGTVTERVTATGKKSSPACRLAEPEDDSAADDGSVVDHHSNMGQDSDDEQDEPHIAHRLSEREDDMDADGSVLDHHSIRMRDSDDEHDDSSDASVYSNPKFLGLCPMPLPSASQPVVTSQERGQNAVDDTDGSEYNADSEDSDLGPLIHRPQAADFPARAVARIRDIPAAKQKPSMNILQGHEGSSGINTDRPTLLEIRDRCEQDEARLAAAEDWYMKNIW